MKDLFIENFADCPFYYEIILQLQQGFKSVYRTSQ